MTHIATGFDMALQWIIIVVVIIVDGGHFQSTILFIFDKVIEETWPRFGIIVIVYITLFSKIEVHVPCILGYASYVRMLIEEVNPV